LKLKSDRGFALSILVYIPVSSGFYYLVAEYRNQSPTRNHQPGNCRAVRRRCGAAMLNLVSEPLLLDSAL
jgi:hypothetical protein